MVRVGSESAAEEPSEKARFSGLPTARVRAMRGGRLWLRRKRVAIKGGARIRDAEPLRSRKAILLSDQIEGRPQQRRPGFGIVRVGSKEVDPVMVHQPEGSLLRRLAESPGEGAGGDLDKCPGLQPLQHAIGLAGEDEIAFWGGDDRRHAGERELVEGLRGVG